MPVDHKRINGPEESVPYELFVRSQPEKTSENKNAKALDRKIYIQTGIVSQAKGSAYIEIGQTKVLVSVFDPREIPNRVDYGLKGEVFCEFKYAPFSCRKRKLHQQNNDEKQYSNIMKKALESAICLHELPNFQVDVFSLVLQEDGSGLSGAIIGAGVALTEAGVPMFDIITSVTLRIIQDDVIVEPSLSDDWNRKLQLSDDDSNSKYGMMVISKLHTHQQLCQFYQAGYISQDKVKICLQILSKACDVIVPIVKKCLFKGIMNHIKS